MPRARSALLLWWGFGVLACAASFLLPHQWETLSALALIGFAMLATHASVLQRTLPQEGTTASVLPARYAILIGSPFIVAAREYHRPGLQLLACLATALIAYRLWRRGKAQA